MDNHVLKIAPDSEGEVYFVNTIMPNCKDEVVVRLGEDFGMKWNEYEITHDDFNRCRDFVIKKTQGA